MTRTLSNRRDSAMTVERHPTAVSAAGRRRGGLPAALAAMALMLAAAAPAVHGSLAPATEPSFSQTETISASPGVTVTLTVEDLFDNAGTNPVFQGVGYHVSTYLDPFGTGLPLEGPADEWTVTVLSDEDLNALSPPPSSPFTFKADVTMENDEGQTASGTVTFQTTYQRDASTPLTPSEPEEAPSFSQTVSVTAHPGVPVTLAVDSVFDNAGTNPRFTGATFNTTTYLDRTVSGISDTEPADELTVAVLTAAELNALSPPPPTPFSFYVNVTMENDEGQTASGFITFRTIYSRIAPPGEGVPRYARPILDSNYGVQNAPPGEQLILTADTAFFNAGTNPRYTSATFSTKEYYDHAYIVQSGNHAGYLYVQAKTAAELNALASPPPSPFDVTADMTMENDEGGTAEHTITFRTTYAREAPESSEPPPAPTFSHTGTISAAPGAVTTVLIDDLFDNPGTNPRFTVMGFVVTTYLEDYDMPHERRDSVTVKVLSEEDLNALSPPPPSPFTFKMNVSMRNDEGRRASGRVTFETTYTRKTAAPTPPASEGGEDG